MVVNILPEDAVSFFKHVVLDTLRERDENNRYRPDVIQLLLEARKGKINNNKHLILR